MIKTVLTSLRVVGQSRAASLPSQCVTSREPPVRGNKDLVSGWGGSPLIHAGKEQDMTQQAACGGTGSEFPRLFFPFLSSSVKGSPLPPHTTTTPSSSFTDFLSSSFPAPPPIPSHLPPSHPAAVSAVWRVTTCWRTEVCCVDMLSRNAAGIKTSLIWTLAGRNSGMKRIY